MIKKRILFITYENPLSKDNGDRIYTSNFLDGLIDLESNIDILCYDSNKNIEKSYDRKRADGYEGLNIQYVKFKAASKLKVMFSLLPGMVVNRKRENFIDVLKSKLKKNNYDYIFVNHLKMVFTLDAIIHKSLNAKLCFISHNAEYLLSKNNAVNSRSIINRIIYWQDALKTKNYEDKMLNHFDYITTISEHDLDYYNMNFINPEILILRPVFGINNLKIIDKNQKKINEIVIVGSFLWGPKTENLLSFLNSKNFKKIHANNLKLTIVGNADPELVKKVNSNYSGVIMTGKVESVDIYYAKAKIGIVPEVLGGGFKLKVAESALQKTAIFSVKGAITKCNLEKDKHFIEASNFEELINKVIEYQNREIEIDAMIEKAFKVAKHDFSKNKFKSDIIKILSN